MYLLDTNIVAMLDPRRHAVAPNVTAWLRRNGASLFVSVITITEMDAGVLKLRRTKKFKRADELDGLVTTSLSDFAGRVLAVDLETARHVASLGEFTYRQPVSFPDLIVAATAIRHGLTVFTHNMSEFGRLGIKAHDPFIELPLDIV